MTMTVIGEETGIEIIEGITTLGGVVEGIDH
jgi:hypothetical protein